MSGAAAAALLQFALTQPLASLVVGPKLLLYGLLLAIGATVLPSFLLNAALQRISAQANATIGTLSPVITILLAVAILGETFTWIDAAGTALVLAGVGWFTLADRRSAERPRSEMHRLEPGRHGRLAHRLRHGRVGVAGAREVLGRAAELHQHRRLVDHLAGAGADDVDAEHAVGRLVGEDLHEAVGVVHGAGAGIGGEGEFADAILDAGLLQLLLAAADRRRSPAWCRRRSG